MFKFKGRTLFAMPPYHITKQKVLHFSIFLGKEIKLKNEGGGKFFKLGERIYTPGKGQFAMGQIEMGGGAEPHLMT